MDEPGREALDAFLAEHASDVAAEFRRMHASIIASFPDLEQRWIAGWRMVGFYLPRGRRLALLTPVDEQIVLYLEDGAALPDPHGLLRDQAHLAKLRKIFVAPPASDEFIEQILDYLDLQYEFRAV